MTNLSHLPLTMIRAFAVVYQAGGVRAAARRLHVTHSAVSRHIKELETWVGVPLFLRQAGKRTLVFSAEGDALGRAALACLAELDSTVTSIREARRSNTVTLSTTPSFASRWLVPRLAAFNARHPQVQVSVVVDQRLHAPAEEGADLAVRMGNRPWPGLNCQPLMDDVLYPVMSPTYWQAHGRPTSVASLVHLRLLHDRDPYASWAVWQKTHGPAALNVRIGSRFTSSDLVLCAAEHHLGVALARERLLGGTILSGGLISPIRDAQICLAHAYWLLVPETTPARDAVAKVVEWLQEEAEKPFEKSANT